MYMERNMKIIEKEVNVSTGEETIIERDETAFEKKEREASEKTNAKLKVEADIKSAARQAIAERLGLTVDELQVLFG